MADNSIRTPKILSQGDIGRPKGSGVMSTQECGVHAPLPCIVILVHGVNDVGEAYQHQDEGICAGLRTRLGRKDLHPHEWNKHEFMISDEDGNVINKSCAVQDQTCVGVVNRSPVIPFYWGYKPVDHSTWQQDQKRYRADLVNKPRDADLPYDTYREFDAQKIKAHNGENIDNLNNWLDPTSAKGGGTFANATTNIPDMFGPGTAGVILAAIGKVMSRNDLINGRDWSHPIYQNPHRIYQAYAARRLADLILDIRKNPETEKDTINIVAHSQGTIITMLANMWVVEADGKPADCVILNHSPYALENRWLENAMPGNQQTSEARQKTLANFCRLMAQNSHYQKGGSHDGASIEALTDAGCLSLTAKWSDPRFNRNNFGMVYNYFCPNDQVVSMAPIQGFGWRGIPDTLRGSLGENLRQRVFCKGQQEKIGEKTGYHFEMPVHKKDDSEATGYSYSDVTIDAPLLPEPFEFKLMAQGEGYKAALSGNDPEIAKAAMKAERFISETIDVPDSPQFYHLTGSSALSPTQLAELNARYPAWEIVKGEVAGNRNSFQQLIVHRRMTEKELNKVIELNHPVFSQHSSIVASIEVSEKSTAYDLAIGQCQAFEDEDFWNRLLLRADWRRPGNPIAEERAYYEEGILPFEHIKQFMNKPERSKGMPLGELGVVNDYGPRQQFKPGNKRNMENQLVDIPQWDMPKPQV